MKTRNAKQIRAYSPRARLVPDIKALGAEKAQGAKWAPFLIYEGRKHNARPCDKQEWPKVQVLADPSIGVEVDCTQKEFLDIYYLLIFNH